MTSTAADFQQASGGLQEIVDAYADKKFSKPLTALAEAAIEVGNSWSGSWLGYHSLVYYDGLRQPPPGAHFSSEWGLMRRHSRGMVSAWVEYQYDDVRKEIFRRAGDPDLSATRTLAKSSGEQFEDIRSQVLSILETELAKRVDTYLQRLLDEVKKTKLISGMEYLEAVRPKGRLMSRDSVAINQGLKAAPHIGVAAEIYELDCPGIVAAKLLKITRQAADHMKRTERDSKRAERIGTNVFIGHGRSKLWKDLKDFIQDRLALPWDEFNRVPVAGVTNIARLSEMLDAAAIALLIMTAEDEQADGKVHARMNVVHEAGLFQGRLGFTKAIVLLEDGCEAFSNIDGLGQIRFPKGNISAAFEEIRRVLEREGLIETK